MPVAGLLVFELVFLLSLVRMRMLVRARRGTRRRISLFRFFLAGVSCCARGTWWHCFGFYIRDPPLRCALRTITQSGDHQPPTGVIYRRDPRFTRCTMNLFCEVAARARLSPVQQTRKSAKTKGVLVLVNSQSTRRGPSRLLSPSRGPFGPLDLPLGLLSRPCRRPCLPIPTTPRRRRKKPQTTPKRQSP